MQYILLIDDEKTFVSGLKYSLEQEEYSIDIAENAFNAEELISSKDYSMIIMEIELSDKNGLNLCQDIRRKSSVPIIVITSNTEEIKKILALEYGADDYLIKPINILELKARMKALFRRVEDKYEDAPKSVLEFKHFKINSIGRKVYKGDQEISLTGKEFDLLYTLASSQGEIFSRDDLLQKVWGYQYYGDARTVDVHIRRIRNKIEDNTKNPKYLKTKWGIGYYFSD